MFFLSSQGPPEHSKLSVADVYWSRNLYGRILIKLMKTLLVVNNYISLLQLQFLTNPAFLARNYYLYDSSLDQPKMQSRPSVIKQNFHHTPKVNSHSDNCLLVNVFKNAPNLEWKMNFYLHKFEHQQQASPKQSLTPLCSLNNFTENKRQRHGIGTVLPPATADVAPTLHC